MAGLAWWAGVPPLSPPQWGGRLDGPGAAGESPPSVPPGGGEDRMVSSMRGKVGQVRRRVRDVISGGQLKRTAG